MAKTTAPMLSFGASGQIGKTQVYSSWRGIPYARRHVVPSNPQSTNQTKTRSVFAWASNSWKQAGTTFRAPFKAAAVGQGYTDRNIFIGKNTKALRAGTNLTAVILSPGNGGGLPPTAATPTGGAGAITSSVTAPTAPSGYTLAGACMSAVPAGDPHSATDFATYANEDTATKNAPGLTGLAAGDYEVALYLHWTKSSGADAYSVGLHTTVTVS